MNIRTSPDLVLTGGNFLTLDDASRTCQAIAIAGDRIAAVGRDKDILTLVGPETRRIDLDGKTAMPGLIDGHAHMDNEGLKYVYPSLAGLNSVASVLERIEKLVANSAAGE